MCSLIWQPSQFATCLKFYLYLQLNCRANFKEGSAGPRSSSGEALPRLVWYYRQPEIPGDVPIPSQLFPVSPPRMETLNIGAQENHKISIGADAYSFRDDNAEFHCNAYMESADVPVASKTVYIQSRWTDFPMRAMRKLTNLQPLLRNLLTWFL